MPTWLTKFAPALFALMKKAASSLGLLIAYVSGRRSQREADQRESLKMLRKGADAGASVKLDADSLRDSPQNRDSK